MPNHVPASKIRARARELRALSDKKSAAFRESQFGSTLEILTLNSKPVGAGFTPPGVNFNHGVRDDSPSRGPSQSTAQSSTQSTAPYTPAISSNYVQVRLAGVFPPNQLLRAKITRHENGVLHAAPETKSNFAVHHAAPRL
jgi:hypothetical protein